MLRNVRWPAMIILAAAAIGACGKSTPIAPTTTPAMLAPDGDFAVQGAVLIRTEGGGTYPLYGADVVATNGSYRKAGRTAGDGSFRIDGLTSGTWTFSVDRQGFLGDAQLVTIQDGDVNVAFELDIDRASHGPEHPDRVHGRL